jgi:dihydroneopterin aldolase
MTRLLARVGTPDEARRALAAGADIIDVADSRHAIDVIAAIGGRRPVSVALGDPTMGPADLAAAAIAASRVDFARVALPSDRDPAPVLEALAKVASGIKLIAVVFADRDPDPAWLDAAARAGFFGAMLDMRSGDDRRLLDVMDLPRLRRFVRSCHGQGLLSGLAGGLEPPDVPRLLVLEPGFLGVRGRTRLMRALIPTEAADGEVGQPFFPPRGETGPTDLVFVHDLVLPARIGAYAREHEAPRRVRFDVDATIRRLARPSHDMRDVFSYDIISDGIRMILDAGHIPLVETLAERIAAMVLAHARVTKVMVRVEKLDLGAGTVGVAIERTRADIHATSESFHLSDTSEPGSAG